MGQPRPWTLRSLNSWVSCFPDCSVGKESACNAGDPGSIYGSGRSAGEGIGYPIQYSWASLVVQLVKNMPTMQETWVWFLGWEDFPWEGKGYPLQYSGLENSMGCIVHGVAKSWTQLRAFQFNQCLFQTLAIYHYNWLWECFYCWSANWYILSFVKMLENQHLHNWGPLLLAVWWDLSLHTSLLAWGAWNNQVMAIS